MPGGTDDVTRTTGFTFTGSYSYNDRYFADLTLRTNGSSRFGKDKKWANFWSLGLGWNLHNEAFMENVDWLKQFKVVASIGTTGNQALLANQSLAMYKYIMGTSYVGGFTGSTVSNMENPTLQWEQKLEKTVGFKGSIWKFDFNFNLYDNTTENLVTQLTLHPSSGFTSYYENIGEISNKGFDGDFSFTAFNNKNGFLKFDINFAHNKNKIEKISDAMKKYNENIMNAFT